MTDHTVLADRYIAMWNETDAERRRTLIAETWSENARYVDPQLNGEGHVGIDAMVAAVQQHYPGFRFTRIGPVTGHNDVLRFAWTLGPVDGPAAVTGTDFGTVDGSGRLSTMTGFFDHVALPAAA